MLPLSYQAGCVQMALDSESAILAKLRSDPSKDGHDPPRGDFAF